MSSSYEPKELSTGISNTEESSTRFGDASGFNLENSTFSINPDMQLAPFSFDAGFNPNLDLSAFTTEGPNWSAIQQSVSDFTQGYMEFAGGLKDGYLNSIILGYNPHYVPTDSTFYNSGRVAGDIVSGIQGIAEIIGGSGLGGLGASACSTGGGCVLTGPAILAGNDLIAHGILVTGSGAFNLGKDLTNFFAQENEGTGSAETGAQGEGGPSNVPQPGTLTGNLNDINSAEKSMVKELLNQGKNIEIVPRGASRTPDFRVDGVSTELKTLASAGKNTLKNAIQDASEQGQQILIDARNVPITAENAQQQILRAQGNLLKSSKPSVEGRVTVLTKDGTISF